MTRPEPPSGRPQRHPAPPPPATRWWPGSAPTCWAMRATPRSARVSGWSSRTAGCSRWCWVRICWPSRVRWWPCRATSISTMKAPAWPSSWRRPSPVKAWPSCAARGRANCFWLTRATRCTSSTSRVAASPSTAAASWLSSRRSPGTSSGSRAPAWPPAGCSTPALRDAAGRSSTPMPSWPGAPTCRPAWTARW